MFFLGMLCGGPAFIGFAGFVASVLVVMSLGVMLLGVAASPFMLTEKIGKSIFTFSTPDGTRPVLTDPLGHMPDLPACFRLPQPPALTAPIDPPYKLMQIKPWHHVALYSIPAAIMLLTLLTH